jgi:hypothetical protein
MNETNVVEAAAEAAAENEQKGAKEAEVEEGAEEKALIDHASRGAGLSQREREITAEDGGGRVEIEGVLRAIEEALPEFLRQSRARATRQEHPAGEAFFRGEAEEVSDAEAEEVARKQLERSGLLRGQRVRVGD